MIVARVKAYVTCTHLLVTTLCHFTATYVAWRRYGVSFLSLSLTIASGAEQR